MGFPPYIFCEVLPNQPFSVRVCQGFMEECAKHLPEIPVFKNARTDRAVLLAAECKAALMAAGTSRVHDLVRSLDIPLLNYSNNCGAHLAMVNVFSDDGENGRCAAKHLLAKGYQRFLFVGLRGVVFSEERLKGFREALESAGHGVEIGELVFPPIPNPVALHEDTEKQMRSFLPEQPQPLGICCANDALAESFRSFLLRRLPEQSSLSGIVGIDDAAGDSEISGAGKCEGGLSSVRPDFEAVGRRCAVEIAHALQTGVWERGKVVRVPGARLIERESTGGFSCDDVMVVRLSRRIHQLVEAGESPRVDALAAEFRASSRTLLYHFQAACGQSLREYILELRLQRAARLCSDLDRSLFDIAYACGFDKQGALSTHFRKRFGQSPAAYRKSIRSLEVST